ncbi:MAG TPA: hypothetical protein VF092_26410 [Longimicrobium sp.]
MSARDPLRAPRWIFRAAAIYGVLVIAPQYFLEARIGRDNPPPITHPEYFYGFLGVTLAWQIAFFVISANPVRLRPLMPVAVLEKLAFGPAALILWAMGHAAGTTAAFGCVDMLLGALFLLAWRMTPDVEHRS